jgi:hypothetical protein
LLENSPHDCRLQRLLSHGIKAIVLSVTKPHAASNCLKLQRWDNMSVNGSVGLSVVVHGFV